MEKLQATGGHYLETEKIETLTWKQGGNKGVANKDIKGKFLQRRDEVR